VSHPIDLSALLAVAISPDVHAAAPAMPVFNFDHAGAELQAASHA
jgi:hypothetical protein